MCGTLCNQVDEWECCELAAHLLGLTDQLENNEIGENEVWGALWGKHEIEEESFCWLINQLLPMVDVGKSVLGNRAYKGFSKKLCDGISEFIVKMEVSE